MTRAVIFTWRRPQGHLAMSGPILVVTSRGGGVWAAREWRPGMSVTILQCTGHPHNKELSSPNVGSSEIEKPSSPGKEKADQHFQAHLPNR